MPSREYVEQQQAMSQAVSADRLLDKFREPGKPLLLDCRSASDFHTSHIRGAINVTLPASLIVLRRLANGKLCLPSAIRDNDSRDKFSRLWKTLPLVLYNSDSNTASQPGSCVLSTLFQRLENEGCTVHWLQGGFNAFRNLYPEWCEGDDCLPESSLIGLENLRITTVADAPSSDPERCDSGLAHTPDQAPFPVEILPYLFLGSGQNSRDKEALDRHKIRYILNVTPNLPNTFEQQGLGIKYMKIPIQDHWSQNLAGFFPEAIAFIDEARQKKLGVLVHCLAGISRSVTITLAYLMYKLSMTLNDAYDFVRQRKANIAPNFNFMGQLKDFEQQLTVTAYHCTCHESQCSCQTLHFLSPTRTTPDSGIRIDCWT